MKGNVNGMSILFRQYGDNAIEWKVTIEFGGASH